MSGSDVPPPPLEESAEEEEQRRFRASVEGTVPTARPNNVAVETPAAGNNSETPESDEKSDVNANPS